MTRRIVASDPRWKTAGIRESLKTKLLAKTQEIVKNVPYRGTHGQKSAAAAVIDDLMTGMAKLGYQIELPAFHGGSDKLSWVLIELPLLQAIERGLEEYFEKYVEEALKKADIVEVASLFRTFASEAAENMAGFIQNHTPLTSAKATVKIDDDYVELQVQDVGENDLTRQQQEKLEQMLDAQANAFAREHGLEVSSWGTDLYGDKLYYKVQFSGDD